MGYSIIDRLGHAMVNVDKANGWQLAIGSWQLANGCGNGQRPAANGEGASPLCPLWQKALSWPCALWLVEKFSHANLPLGNYCCYNVYGQFCPFTKGRYLMAPHITRTIVAVAVVVSCFLAVCTAQPDSARAQGQYSGGAQKPDPEELKKVQPWKPDEMGISVNYVVDLRPYLPPVGKQRMNDCAAWATAYAAKSYLEVIDQKWKADAPERVFSPTFIYNQINGGRNKGCSILNAMKLMKLRGCATLKTCPYKSTDFTSQPTDAAFREARQFKIADYYRLFKSQEIRLALSQGLPVLIAARTNRDFNSGAYDVYDMKMHKKARATRIANQKHGFHAMCIVGYDDSRKAFLFLNSWSSRWGKKGYCWVGYDVMDEIEYIGDSLVYLAYVMKDVKYSVVRRSSHVDPTMNLYISGRHWYHGIEPTKKKPQWYWRLYISGQSAGLDKIKKVDWTLHWSATSSKTVMRSNRRTQYEVAANKYTPGQFRVDAKITFKNNATRTVTRVFRVAQEYNLRLIQTDRYWGKDRSGQSRWDWWAKIDGSLTQLNDIRQVTYHLHPTFRPRDRVIRASLQNGFAFQSNGWGTFNIAATVDLKDGGKIKLTCPMKFKDPVQDKLVLKNTAYMDSIIRGQKWYTWTVSVDGPWSKLQNIQKVRYKLHPTFNPNTIDVTTRSAYGFPLSRRGWGTFKVQATLYFKNGATQALTHQLKF